VERGAQQAASARNGFHGGFLSGLAGMALAGLSRGRLSIAAHILQLTADCVFNASLKLEDVAALSVADGRPLHDALMTARDGPRLLSMGACSSRIRMRC